MSNRKNLKKYIRNEIVNILNEEYYSDNRIALDVKTSNSIPEDFPEEKFKKDFAEAMDALESMYAEKYGIELTLATVHVGPV